MSLALAAVSATNEILDAHKTPRERTLVRYVAAGYTSGKVIIAIGAPLL